MQSQYAIGNNIHSRHRVITYCPLDNADHIWDTCIEGEQIRMKNVVGSASVTNFDNEEQKEQLSGIHRKLLKHIIEQPGI
jgi:hypothetical protein